MRIVQKTGIIPAIFTTSLLFTSIPANADPNTPLPVTIYATQSQTGTPLTEIGSSVTVIGEEEIKSSGAITAADALRHVPGLAVNQAGGPGSFTQLRIRGGEANHLLLLIDGVRYNDPSGFGLDFSGLLARDIESIEIIRGPQSGIYGSDAHAGVIAVTTKSGKGLKKPIVEANIEGGSLDTLSGSIFGAGGNGTAWGSISATGITTQGYNIATTGTEADGANIGELNLRFGAAPIDGLNLDGVLRYASRRAEYDDTNFFDPIAPPYIDSSLPHYTQDDISGRASASYRAPGSAVQQYLSWDGYHFNRDNIDAFGPFNAEGQRQQALYRIGTSFTTSGFADARHDLSFQASREWLDYTTTFQPLHSLATTGLAGEWRTSFSNNFFLSAAIRHDISDFFANPTTWRLTAKHNLENGISLHAAAGTGITNPTLDELFGAAGGFVGNPALKPEESFEWETGVDKTWFNGQLTTGLTYFNGRTKNEIRTLFFPVFTAVNDPGVSPRQGVEALLSYSPLPGFSISGTYTYTDARTAAGLEEVRRPPHSGSLDLTWHFWEDKASLKLGAAFNGAMQDDDFRTFPSPRVRLSGYTLLNAVLSYRINDRTEVYARVQNALDQDYQEVFGIRGQPLSAYAGIRMTLE
jgi:vitamin B12 transporter